MQEVKTDEWRINSHYEFISADGTIWKNRQNAPQGGLAFLVKKSLVDNIQENIITYGDRVGRLTLITRFGKKVNIINCYAPTEVAAAYSKDNFYRQLNKVMDDVKPSDITIICGDFNGEIIKPQSEEGEDEVAGLFSRERLESENGSRLLEFARKHGLKDVGSRFQKSWNRTWTFKGIWQGNDSKRFRVYDRFMMKHEQVSMAISAKAFCGTGASSDHKPMEMKLNASLLWNKNPGKDEINHIRKALRQEENIKLLEQKVMEKFPTEEIELTHFENVAKDLFLNRKPEKAVAKKDYITEATLQLIDQRAEHEYGTPEWITLNRKVREQAKIDKNAQRGGHIDNMQKASNAGATKQVFEAVDALAEKPSHKSTRIYPASRKPFFNYWQKLLGEPSPEPPKCFEDTNAWKLAEKALNDNSETKPRWEVEVGDPTLAEVTKAVFKLKRNKAGNGCTPPELFKRSEIARAALHRACLKVWRKEDIEDEWLTAQVALIHKKGSKSDPKNYRPIALLHTVENVLSQVVFLRIAEKAMKTLNKKQFGFLKGRSCRHAVHLLLRDLERNVSKKSGKCLIFADFSKAFDSLRFDRMWACLRSQGCPPEIVTVLERMYDDSKVEIKYAPGVRSERFHQARGIRQGSTLSPLIFIIVLDWALQIFEKSLNDLKNKGIKGLMTSWLAYADDVALKAKNEKLAGIALREFEAACRYVGLSLAWDKTEIMSINLKPMRVAPKDAKTQKICTTREEGEGDDGELMDIEGGYKLLNDCDKHILNGEFARSEATHLIKFHDPDGDGRSKDWTPCIVTTNSWVRYEDGRTDRIVRLEDIATAESQSKKYRCDICNLTFETAAGLKRHKSRPGLMHALHNRTKHQRTAAKYQRDAKRAKQLRHDEEVNNKGIIVRTLENNALPTCNSFKYLGTTITPRKGMGPEIKKRATTALVVIAKLKKIFRDRSLKAKLKKELFHTLVLSIFLYNVETWALSRTQKDWAEKIYRRMISMAFGRRIRRVRGRTIRESNRQLHARTGLDTLEYIIGYRKAMWVSHITRGDEPMTKSALELSQKLKDFWWIRYEKDIQAIRTTHEEILAHSHQPVTLKKLIRDRKDTRTHSNQHNSQVGPTTVGT
jgi:exonuclease III